MPAAARNEERTRVKTTEDFSGRIAEESVEGSTFADSKTKSLQEAGSHEEIERHEIDPDISVDGSMSLINVSVKYNVPVSHLAGELDLPSNVSGNERLGRLKHNHNFRMSDIEMIKNGAEVIHFATGFLVGYPPCPYIDHFKSFIEEKYGVKVVLGTHPIPEKYLITHTALGTWDSPEWQERIKDALPGKDLRLAYN
ncbi:MAG: CGGC domain-containing protein [Bacteroidales bacterium]|nr:CGGC domain-containing protein [Bacteroidales bacterium]